MCVLIDVSSLLTKGGDSREQERQLRKLIGLRDWMMAVLAFPVGAVRACNQTHIYKQTEDTHKHTVAWREDQPGFCICSVVSSPVCFLALTWPKC